MGEHVEIQFKCLKIEKKVNIFIYTIFDFLLCWK